MTDFKDVHQQYRWEEIEASIYATSSADVESALQRKHRSLNDFMALISPAAEPYLEQMAELSQQATRNRFGYTMQMYAPLYLSNECQNMCTYCGFSYNNTIKRKTLNKEEILKEAMVLKQLGFEHVLLVTGESHHKVGLTYFMEVVHLLKPHFAQISLEVQPLHAEEYVQLVQLGVHAVMVYQETYNTEVYKQHHLKGRKSNFAYRLLTPDRLGQAGIHKIGIGALLGLTDWRVDSFFTALHLSYLEQRYWRTKYSISFPRLRPYAGCLTPAVNMKDKELVQLICAYRLYNQEVELSLSTRESQRFRNNMAQLGITSMSAGSKTNPGGYAVDPQSLEQFEISDDRSPSEIEHMLLEKGYDPVWKDWDIALEGTLV